MGHEHNGERDLRLIRGDQTLDKNRQILEDFARTAMRGENPQVTKGGKSIAPPIATYDGRSFKGFIPLGKGEKVVTAHYVKEIGIPRISTKYIQPNRSPLIQLSPVHEKGPLELTDDRPGKSRIALVEETPKKTVYDKQPSVNKGKKKNI